MHVQELMYKNTEISNLIVALGLGTERSTGLAAAGGAAAAAAAEQIPEEANKALAQLRCGSICMRIVPSLRPPSCACAFAPCTHAAPIAYS